MKLRNKKTGEIVEWEHGLQYKLGKEYRSIKEFAEEWEDVPEELKRHWIIDTMNDRVEDFDVPMAFNESIGNYFDTREQAELAVEKLKAWKRLRDKGFRFILDDNFAIKFVGPDVKKIVSAEEARMLRTDYKLLFGGEE